MKQGIVVQQAQTRRRLLLPAVCFIILAAWQGIFFFHKLDLTQGDLGRHLKNGQIIVVALQQINFKEASLLLTTNYYAATVSEFAFVNHHWLSGVLFYGWYAVAGYTGLSVLLLLFSIAILAIFFDIARRQAGPLYALSAGFLLVPVFAERNELRPELFSYLFAGIVYWILLRFRSGQYSARALWWLPIIGLVWVNTHIYFVLGPYIVGVFLLEALITRRPGFAAVSKKLVFAIVGLCIVSVLNPNFVSGALYPFRIFQNYGLVIRENLSIPALLRIAPGYGNFIVFKVAVFLMLALVLIVKIKKTLQPLAVPLFFSIVFGVWAYGAARNVSLFGWFALPALAGLLRSALPMAVDKKFPRLGPIVCGVVLLLIAALSMRARLSSAAKLFGSGLAHKHTAAGVLAAENISGPLFNDFDSGGQVIWYAFPKARPFVDNRPEAYPPGFFKSAYLPPLSQEKIWQEALKTYQFNAIVYSLSNLASTTIPFIVHRLQDPLWAPIFADTRSILFIRRLPQNESVIKRLELPPERFQITTR